MVRTPCSTLSRIPMEVCTKTEITSVPNLRTTVLIGSRFLSVCDHVSFYRGGWEPSCRSTHKERLRIKETSEATARRPLSLQMRAVSSAIFLRPWTENWIECLGGKWQNFRVLWHSGFTWKMTNDVVHHERWPGSTCGQSYLYYVCRLLTSSSFPAPWYANYKGQQTILKELFWPHSS